jgi:hypothetical protein
MKITKLKIFGERNTGTNALRFLIEANIGDVLCLGATAVDPNWSEKLSSLPDLAQPYRQIMREALIDDIFLRAPAEHRWKHTAPYYSPRYSQKGIGIIFLIKNPYSWVVSLFKRPYHMLLPQTQNFSDFLRRPWFTVRRDNLPGVVSSPIELWNRKVLAYDKFAKAAQIDQLPCLFVAFEQLVEDQASVIEKIRKTFEFPHGSISLLEISTIDLGLNLVHYQKFYRSEEWLDTFSAEDLEFCTATINWSMASQFGYQMIRAKSKGEPFLVAHGGQP